MHINKLACKKFLLRLSESNRGGKFTRVGADVYDHLDSILMSAMQEFVRRHPSVGKTLSTGKKKDTDENS